VKNVYFYREKPVCDDRIPFPPSKGIHADTGFANKSSGGITMSTTKKADPKKAKGRTTQRKTAKTGTPKKGKVPVAGKRGRAQKTDADFNTAFLANLNMKQDELKDILDRLMSCRNEYHGQLNAGDFIDEIDDAQREISAQKLHSLIERKHKELRNIDRLIGRILKEEEFGLCEECGVRIPKERLLIVPETTLCISCQRELEKWDHRMNSPSGASLGFGKRQDLDWDDSDEPDDEETLLMEYQIGSYPLPETEDTPPENTTETKND
jgi:DnaK suppressor protein